MEGAVEQPLGTAITCLWQLLQYLLMRTFMDCHVGVPFLPFWWYCQGIHFLILHPLYFNSYTIVTKKDLLNVIDEVEMAVMQICLHFPGEVCIYNNNKNRITIITEY